MRAAAVKFCPDFFGQKRKPKSEILKAESRKQNFCAFCGKWQHF
jgi:hypothetical protein